MTPVESKNRKGIINFSTLLIFSFAVILWIIPYFLNLYTVYVFTWLLIYIIAAYGLNLILGYAGQISLAQAAFMGIGAYVVAILTKLGYSFWIAFPLAGLLSFLVGIILGFPSLKVKHHYLAMVTIGFNFIIYKILMNEEQITGGPYGIMNIPRPTLGFISFESDLSFAHLVLIISLLMVFLMYYLLNTQWGRAFKMIRENEVRAEVVGVDLRLYKLTAFAIGSAYAGIAGGLLPPLFGYIEPTLFELVISFDFLLMVLIGGRGRFVGPILGVSIVILLPEILRITEQLNLLIFSIIAIIVIVLVPEGASSLVDITYKLFTGEKFPSLTK